MKRKDSDTRDPSTDGLSSTQVRQLREQLHADQATVHDWARQVGQENYFEAAVILIAHPENKRLGTRFTLAPGEERRRMWP